MENPGSLDISNYSNIKLRSLKEWTVTTLDHKPGLYILSDVFEPQADLEWMRCAMFEYCQPPNCTNNNPNGENKEVNFKDLRWATLGYDYNWTTKEYPETPRSPLPDEFVSIGKAVTEALGLSLLEADTAILNYYKLNSRLSPHVDRSEKALDKALVSISFGQSAIYLSGGLSPDDDVDAIMLHSGDLIVMSGEQRLVWHAVPRILKTRTFELGHKPNKQDVQFLNYINEHRINVTLRQTAL
uniref:Fe2OG dioxygenase domain-containing protein n=1 Tax=Panagrolaimus sp. JU765 TaxID=591449 RepID=A0AC34RHQ6_9BILA